MEETTTHKRTFDQMVKQPYMLSSPLKAVRFQYFGTYTTPEGTEKSVITRYVPIQLREHLESSSPFMKPFGSGNDIHPCVYCKMDRWECPGHRGFIDLKQPVYAYHTLKIIKRVLNLVCMDCGSLLLHLDESDLQRYRAMQRNGANYAVLRDLSKYSHSKICQQACKRQSEKPLFSLQLKKHESRGIYVKMTAPADGKDREKRYVTADECLMILNKISLETAEMLGFQEHGEPKNLILRYLVVMPPEAQMGNRTSDEVFTNSKSNNTFNGKYLQILHTVNQGSHWRVLQDHVNELFNNVPQSSDNFSGIQQILKAKEGVLRGNVFGKRVDFSARFVLAHNPKNPFNVISVPRKTARVLTNQQRVTHYNILHLTQLALDGLIVSHRFLDSTRKPVHYHLAPCLSEDNTHPNVRQFDAQLNIQTQRHQQQQQQYVLVKVPLQEMTVADILNRIFKGELTPVSIVGDRRLPLNIPGRIDNLEQDQEPMETILMTVELCGKQFDLINDWQYQVYQTLAETQLKIHDMIEFRLQPAIMDSYALQRVDQLILHPLYIGDVMDVCLMEGNRLIFNRQPTLHKYGMLAFIVHFWDKNVIGVTLPWALAYNLDFDGDEGNLHNPQSLPAKAEMELVIAAEQNMINVRDNSPICGLTLDCIVVSYILTQETTYVRQFIHDDIIKQLRQDMNPSGVTNVERYRRVINEELDSLDSRLAKHGVNPRSGMAFFSALLPAKLHYEHGGVIVRDGILVKGPVRNVHIDSKHNSIMQSILQNPCIDDSRYRAGQFTSALTCLCYNWFQYHGITLAMDDFYFLSSKMREKTEEIKNKIITEVDDLSKRMTAENREATEQSIVIKTQSFYSLSIPVLEELLPKDNNILLMHRSGVKDMAVTLPSILICLGQQILYGRRIETGPGGRCLPYFNKMDNSALARGFVVSSYLGGMNLPEFVFAHASGREGLLDRSLLISQIGTMQNQMRNMFHDMKIGYNNIVYNKHNDKNEVKGVLQPLFANSGFNITTMREIPHRVIPKQSITSFIDIKSVARTLNGSTSAQPAPSWRDSLEAIGQQYIAYLEEAFDAPKTVSDFQLETYRANQKDLDKYNDMRGQPIFPLSHINKYSTQTSSHSVWPNETYINLYEVALIKRCRFERQHINTIIRSLHQSEPFVNIGQRLDDLFQSHRRTTYNTFKPEAVTDYPILVHPKIKNAY